MAHHRPIILVIDLSESISVGTRKMVNYACIGRSQGKPWWRLVEILTCKLIFKFGYRGERLIEPLTRGVLLALVACIILLGG